jgi:hypothetical protein
VVQVIRIESNEDDSKAEQQAEKIEWGQERA